MKKEPEGNHYDEQAHCYEDLNNENSNAGETPMKGNQWADDVKHGKEVSYDHESAKEEEMEVKGAVPSRGKAGAKEEY